MIETRGKTEIEIRHDFAIMNAKMGIQFQNIKARIWGKK